MTDFSIFRLLQAFHFNTEAQRHGDSQRTLGFSSFSLCAPLRLCASVLKTRGLKQSNNRKIDESEN